MEKHSESTRFFYITISSTIGQQTDIQGLVALITVLHIEQGQTSVTLRKRYKKTRTAHCRKGSWMLLYSVGKVENKTMASWESGGQT